MPLSLRKPARGNQPALKAKVTQSASVPAPVGGWNARDALADMPITDAVTMDNWFPRTSDVRLRGGYSAWSTGYEDPVETLMDYTNGSTFKLFAAAGDSIFDATASGAVGTAEKDSLSNARWQHINFANAGNAYLYAVNGEDDPLLYDGSTWTSPTITNLDATNAIHINVHKKRIWFTEVGTLSAWYLETEAIQGAATEFPLGAQAVKGGYLLAMATWSVDGGSGTDDLAVFITSEGECIIYKGLDPDSDFNLVGVFQIGRPIGRRCFAKYGGDLVIITNSGFYPLSKALITSRASPKVALSDKISGAVHDYALNNFTKFGWQVILYPKGPYLLFNVPTSELAKSDQVVMNTVTQSWCRFKDQSAFCWGSVNDALYFGGATAVYLADDGQDDNGGAITGDIQPAYSYFKSPAIQKKFTLCRPVFAAGGTVVPSLALNTDFSNSVPATPSLSVGMGGTPWGSPWGSPWSTNGYQIRKDWQSVGGIGFAASARVKVMTKTQQISLMSFDYVYEQGGFL